MSLKHVIKFIREDDEQLVIELDGQYVGGANHDEHGWSGMDAVEDAVTAIAKQLKWSVETD